jgi:glyoxylase-like metal-dependent hydrolase (beta-lactamase superfamily II)
MSAWQYTRGLHDIGNGVYAYLQPDGGWGWSNAGLVVDGGASLLIDTLFDLKLTQEMLDTMRAATGAAEAIDTVVNTHANGDHCWGNELVGGATIVATQRTADEMRAVPPQMLAGLVAQAPHLGETGEYVRRIFGPFSFGDITLTLPSQTFEGELTLHVGDKEVRLIEVGPAHTQGDTLVQLPGDRVVFSGDILFIGSHPIMWAGPVENWLRACDRILAMDVEAVVPGHGPITDKRGVAEVKGYFEYLKREARARFDAGMPAFEAAQDISLEDYATWGDAERIAVTVDTLYRGFRGDTSPPDAAALFGQMARLAKSREL